MSQTVRIEFDAAGPQRAVASLVLDAPGRPVNTLSRQMFAELDAAITQVNTLIAADQIVGLVVRSGKERSFVVGADLFELRDMARPELDRHLLEGQRVFARLEALPIHTVAAINGDCLGGGLELALACGSRIAASSVKRIGLPETTLGLVPGWGGTVRLTRLIGAAAALPLLMEGKMVPATEARSAGIVDDVVDDALLVAKTHERAMRPPPVRSSVADPHPSPLPAYRERGSVAASRVVDVVEAGLRNPQAGFDAERLALAELRDSESGRRLMGEFFARQAARKRS